MTTIQGEIMEVESVAGFANMPRDLALLKMENDTIMAAAAARPRDLHEIVENIKTQLKISRRFAQEAIYSKPVGKDDNGVMKYARGLSVRAAEALAEAYGYNRVRADITILPSGEAKIDASFVDYQRGRMWQDSKIVPRRFKTRTGQIREHAEDRYFDVVVGAWKSKLIREVITRSVPPAIRYELETCIEEQIDQFLDDSTVKKIIANFASKGVISDMLEKHLGKRQQDWNTEDRKTLLGIWNALSVEGDTVDSIFGVASENGKADKGAAATAERLKAKQAAKPDSQPVEEDAPPAETDESIGAVAEPAPADAPAPPARVALAGLAELGEGEHFATDGVIRAIRERKSKDGTKAWIEIDVTNGPVNPVTFTYWHTRPAWLKPDIQVNVIDGFVGKPFKGVRQYTISTMEPIE